MQVGVLRRGGQVHALILERDGYQTRPQAWTRPRPQVGLIVRAQRFPLFVQASTRELRRGVAVGANRYALWPRDPVSWIYAPLGQENEIWDQPIMYTPKRHQSLPKTDEDTLGYVSPLYHSVSFVAIRSTCVSVGD
jgi:hypothetical protein